MRTPLEIRRSKRQAVFEKMRNGELSFSVPYPKKRSEAEIQAELWYRLRAEELDARMEVKHEIGSKKTGRATSRFDIVVYNKKKAIVIIEVKNNGKIPTSSTRQVIKYSCYDAELIFCTSEYEIDQTIKKIQKIFKEFQQVKLQSSCNGLVTLNTSPMSPLELSHA